MRVVWGTCVAAALFWACASFTASSDDGPPAVPDAASDAAADDDGGTTDDQRAAPNEPLVLANGQSLPISVTANEEFVYWGVDQPGAVRRVSIEGGAVADVDSYGGSPNQLSVSETNDLVWTDQGAKKGLRHIVVGSGTSPDVFYSEDGFAFARVPDGFVVVSRIRNDVRVVFRPDGSLSLTGNGPYVSPFDVIAKGTEYWFTVSGSAEIRHGDSTALSTAPTVFASNEGDCRSLASAGSTLFWTRYGEGSIRMRDSGGLTSTIVTNQDHPFALIADASGVYWLTLDGKLRRWSNGIIDTLVQDVVIGANADQAPYLHAIALTSKYIVWLTSTEVRRLSK